MVILHVKRTEGNQFLYETTTEVLFQKLLEELVAINNMRLKIDRACQSMEDLASKGPMKPEALRGLQNLDDYVKHEDLTVINGLKEMPPKTGCREVVDETHYRTGWLVSEELCSQILEEVMRGKQMIHKTQVDKKVALTMEAMQQVLDNFRGLTMMAYPGYHGLGDWEPIKVVLENREEFDEKMNLTDDLAVDNTTIWIVSKECNNNKYFHEMFGKNEKQKFVVKLQKKGTGAPQREPVVDEKTQKEMMSYYYKKQEEQKQLEEDNEDSYLNSAWANNKGLKAEMHGTGNINMGFGTKRR